MVSKSQAAVELVQHHFAVEPGLHVVYRIIGDNEESPAEPIKLLEINAATFPTGSVEVFGFGPTRDLPFSVEIAEITPDELEHLQRDPRVLPTGWDLRRVEVFQRPRAAE